MKLPPIAPTESIHSDPDLSRAIADARAAERHNDRLRHAVAVLEAGNVRAFRPRPAEPDTPAESGTFAMP